MQWPKKQLIMRKVKMPERKAQSQGHTLGNSKPPSAFATLPARINRNRKYQSHTWMCKKCFIGNENIFCWMSVSGKYTNTYLRQCTLYFYCKVYLFTEIPHCTIGSKVYLFTEIPHCTIGTLLSLSRLLFYKDRYFLKWRDPTFIVHPSFNR